MKGMFLENIKISLNSIKGQLLRTILTALIIAIGIWALVGILTAIDVMKASINSNFTSMGANTFTIRNRGANVQIGKRGKRPKPFRPISYDEAENFIKNFDFPAIASVSTTASNTGTLKYESQQSNPNIEVIGGDENYLPTSGYEIGSGRNFSAQDELDANHVVVIGNDLISVLFKNNENPLDKVISIGPGKYKIIGVLKSKGTSMGFGGDKVCIIPLSNARQYFPDPDMSYTINVLGKSTQQLDGAINEATGVFRIVRKVPLGEENNFEIVKSDNLANMLIDNIKKVTSGAAAIGIITLLGAAIGLMNIMLVSVTERTREIGIRKAIGATAKDIRNQFLMEAIVICQLGGLFGILFGIATGNIISLQFGIGFIVPWEWIFSGIGLCIFVGIISGIIPALKAAKLDPIEALRFE
ncbi:MAG TPA: ABC transporter permease [Bacteroidia bacterium]|nr:ABC transporter permease [Bacteroidia bacterium]